ncbi:4,5-DOPA dioxygenase extradiol [Pseudopedobacter sp.]|uniref:4,5-DOPA-extradiol-dioxygenase n=1 Tax=Pseudopedobacter sp. TaxID=1936787 RepID=UPI003342B5DD
METLKHLYNWQKDLPETETMPALFIGHGSPMNAIEDNIFVQNWRKLAQNIPKPTAILVISAHWETQGTKVTAMEKPRTIHDFGGFPRALFEVQYPAKGDPELAAYIKEALKHFAVVELDQLWGLDHGNWSVVKHLYPNADIPVLQLSLDYSKPAEYHYNLAKELQILRKKGVLIIGSGNMVHNLRMVSWENMLEPGFGYDWALDINDKMKQYISEDNHLALINYQNFGIEGKYAIPTPEHYMPLIYTLALKDKNDKVSFLNDIPIGGSLTMTSVVIDSK